MGGANTNPHVHPLDSRHSNASVAVTGLRRPQPRLAVGSRLGWLVHEVVRSVCALWFVLCTPGGNPLSEVR